MFFLRIFLGWFNFIVGGNNNALLFASIISAIAAIIIAIATWKYTNYSKQTIEELKKQRELSEKLGKDKYKLERMSICKSLLREINNNENVLEDLRGALEYESVEHTEEEIFENGEPLDGDGFKNIYISFKNEIYNKFFNSGIEFNDCHITENVEKIYRGIIHIRCDIANLKSLNGETKEKHYNKIFKGILKEIEEILQEITKLYKDFKNEIGYDFKISPYYYNSETILKALMNGLEKK